MKTFQRPEGHSCKISTGIHECLTFGKGRLSDGGFWQIPCPDCARAHEQQFPEDGPCWPHTDEQLVAMGFRNEKTASKEK
jgi:hypothetical protein